MAKESPKAKSSDSKMSKKEEKKRKKEMKKSKESLDQVGGGGEIEPATPRDAKKKEKKSASPGKDSVGSSSKRKGIFKRIGSFMLPPPALSASPPAQQERVNMSQSCQDLLGKGSPRGEKKKKGSSVALGSPNSAGSTSASSPNLLVQSPPPPPTSSPPSPPRTPRDGLRSDSMVSVEYAMPLKSLPFSSDEEDGGEGSPRRTSMKSSPSPRKEKHISFAEDEGRVMTPEILKRNLAEELAVPDPPDTYVDDVIDMPEPCDLDGLPLEERCQQQSQLLSLYEEKIHHFRDQVLAIVSENSRLHKLCSQRGVHDIESLQQQAHQVLQENRTLIKEQQMNEARWHDLIEERNQEVLRMRATCTNLEDQNSTLVKRCEKLENRNEEIRDAYNTLVTQADDFVPVSAHLTSLEGYKTALEELRKRYDDNIHEKDEDIAALESTVAALSEKVESVEKENSVLVGQVKGLREALEKAQHNATKHKREAVNLTQRVNTLKSSLAQAIAIAEESTLHKLEVAELLQISDIQDQHNRSNRKLTTDLRVKEVKKRANAKLKSCAEILQERESEYERSISQLNERITKLKMRCRDKDEIIHNLSNTERTATPNESC